MTKEKVKSISNPDIKIPADVKKDMLASKKAWLREQEFERECRDALEYTDEEIEQRQAIWRSILEKLGIEDEVNQIHEIAKARCERAEAVLRKYKSSRKLV